RRTVPDDRWPSKAAAPWARCALPMLRWLRWLRRLRASIAPRLRGSAPGALRTRNLLQRLKQLRRLRIARMRITQADCGLARGVAPAGVTVEGGQGEEEVVVGRVPRQRLLQDVDRRGHIT